VLVAGGATGIGAEVLSALRARGDDVVLVDRNVDAGRRLVDEDAPGGGWFVHCDLAEPDAPGRAVIRAAEMLDGGIDALFYNAGILSARPLEEWTIEEWDRSIAVNLRAPLFMVQAAAPLLTTSTAGRVVLTSSTGGLRGHAGMPAYHASKAGILGMVRALADELGPDGVTVNALCPGWVDTQFNDSFWGHQANPAEALAALEASIPLRRQAHPRELVGTVLYLLSDAASYVTGHALVIDGGYTAV
jgi:NAD(P)-dependent dehydrogenase (short-subunit alcohol dehydrogenase family)